MSFISEQKIVQFWDFVLSFTFNNPIIYYLSYQLLGVQQYFRLSHKDRNRQEATIEDADLQ